MKPVHQTRTLTRGNCWAAAIASILEVPLEDVDLPHPFDAAKLNACLDGEDDDDWQAPWWTAMNAHLAESYGVILVAYEAAAPPPAGYAIAIGTSPRNRNISHAVVVKDGVLAHDPWPGGSGVDNITAWEVLIPIAKEGGGG